MRILNYYFVKIARKSCYFLGFIVKYQKKEGIKKCQY